MAYNTILANRIREYLENFPQLQIEEKEMFQGLTFMINNKMCVSVSDGNLLCRFDPALLEEVAEKRGYEPMTMKGKEYRGYCYVSPEGFESQNDFEYWIGLCLEFNDRAKSSKKKKNSKK